MGRLRFELRTNRLKAESMRLETPWHHWACRLGPQTTPKQQGERHGHCACSCGCTWCSWLPLPATLTSPTTHGTERPPEHQAGQDREALADGGIDTALGALAEESHQIDRLLPLGWLGSRDGERWD